MRETKPMMTSVYATAMPAINSLVARHLGLLFAVDKFRDSREELLLLQNEKCRVGAKCMRFACCEWRNTGVLRAVPSTGLHRWLYMLSCGRCGWLQCSSHTQSAAIHPHAGL